MGGHGEGSPYPEPLTLRDQLQRGEPVRVTHVVMRGTYLPNTARCGYGDPYTPPEYSRDRLAGHLGLGKGLFKCYVDVRANEWLVGTGPSQVTVQVWNFTYEPREYTPLPDDPHGWVTEEDGLEAMRKRIEPAARLYENREQILFLGPPSTLVSQAWYLIHWWNIERQDDGMVLAFERWARDWERLEPETFATFRSRLVLTLPAFKTAIQQAHQLRLTQNGGRIGATTDLPDLVTDARNLDDFYEETGFTDATVPPPACGLAVPDPANDQDLMLDCFALLEGLDDLRGTGTLNWSVDTAIGSWDGVSTGGTPSRVTKLELTNTSLTGSIPAALARLNLTTLKLAGNSLTGCIPVGLKDVPTNDLSTLNLIYCSPPAPAAPTAGTATETSVPLTWAAVANTSAYRVEHRAASEYEWTVADDAITTTSHTVDALECGTAYAFRLSGYGSGTTYAAAWSEPSETVTASTGACTPPVFGATSYSFSVMGDTAVGAAVGTVTATDDSGEAVTYAITAGNDAGLVAIGEATGAITVAGFLDYETTSSYRLRVVAIDPHGEAAITTVEITVTDVVGEGELELWSGEMTAGSFNMARASAVGYTSGLTWGGIASEGTLGTLDDTSFEYGGETYTIELAAYFEAAGSRDPYFFVGFEERRLPTDVELVLYVGNHRLTGWQTTGLGELTTHYYYVANPGFTLESGQVVTLSLRKANPSEDSGLESLAVSDGTLSPAFDADTTTYTATVGSDVTTVTVTAETSSDYATVAVTPAEGDDSATEGVEVALVEGANTITITVTAEDGSTTTYTLTVTRESG